jgi:DHA1 family tetracycline resistance protein-like MFS transporter
MTPIPDDKLDLSKILPVFVIVLVDLLGLTIIIPLLPLYAVGYGADPLMIGALAASYPLMQFVGAPVLGRLSDRIGRRPVLIFSQIGTFIGFILLGFASSLWMLFAARIIDGLSGANISTAQAVITDSTTPKTRTQGLGLIGAAFGLGFIIGPLIAFGVLALTHNTRLPAFIAAGCSLISILLTVFWLPETRPADPIRAEKPAFSPGTLWAALLRPDVGLLLILMAAQQVAFGGLEALLAVFTLNRLGFGASDNAAIFVFVGLIVVSVQGYFIGQWSRRLGERRLIQIGLASLALGMILTSLTPEQPAPWYDRAALEKQLRGSTTASTTDLPISPPQGDQTGWLGLGWILIAMIPASIGGGMLQPSINSLITRRIDADEIGGMLGMSTAMYSGANAIAPLALGLIFRLAGSTAPFMAGGILLAGLLGITVMALKPGREVDAPSGLARGGAAH